MYKMGKMSVPPMSQHRNLDIAGKTPVLGLGAPTNYLTKKFSRA